jgi:aryl-alcohol dehydrogenase-like predicted oxidoreductase
MESAPLGRSGLSVSRVSLGCGNFGGIGSAPQFFGAGESREEALALLDAAWELGINFLDTADAYGGGSSERWIGEWLRSRGDEVRDRIVLCTKVFHSVEGNPDDRGLAPARIRKQVEGSLARLGVERIDLYLTHEPDPATPLEETLGALDELARAGKIGAFGLSQVDAADVERALASARPECVQNSLSLLDRSSEGVVALCARDGLAFTAFSPLAGGVLTGKYRAGEPPPPGSRLATRPGPYGAHATQRTLAAVDALARTAASRGVDAAALSLAWLLADERVTSVVVGPRRPAHFEAVRRALELRLTPAERDDLAAFFV